MKNKKLIFAIVIVIVAGSIYACHVAAVRSGWPFIENPTEIKSGLTPELVAYLKSRYQISIPENAVFIKGINTNSFRDPCIVIEFECPVDEIVPADDDGSSVVFQALDLDESLYRAHGHEDQGTVYWLDDFGDPLDWTIIYIKRLLYIYKLYSE